MILAVIPARYGSKRLPRKNIIKFNGKPMIYWTIKAAIKSNIFDYIIVSTDSKKIARISKKFGASVPFLREKKYADNKVPVHQVTVHTINKLHDKLGLKFKTVIQLMPNCPLRNYKDIIRAYKNFKKKQNNFQLSCFKFSFMNPWWSHKVNKISGKAKEIFRNKIKARSQDLEDLYCPTGAIWIANTKQLIREKTFYGKNYSFFEMNWKNALDIDNYEDIELSLIAKKITK